MICGLINANERGGANHSLTSQEDLVARIADACGRVQEMPAIFEHVRDSMLRRCEACIHVNGRNFEQLL